MSKLQKAREAERQASLELARTKGELSSIDAEVARLTSELIGVGADPNDLDSFLTNLVAEESAIQDALARVETELNEALSPASAPSTAVVSSTADLLAQLDL